MSEARCDRCDNLIDADARCPRFLDCWHYFCTDCLNEMCKKSGGGHIVCPKDDEVTKITPQRPVRMLVPHIPLLSEYQQSHPQSEFEKGDETKRLCQVCGDDPHQATHFCQECEQFMCESVAGLHKRMKSSRDHNVVGVDEAGSQSNQCSEHQEPFILYDTECNCLVCGKCTGIGKHKGHACREAKECLPELRTQLTRCLNDARKAISSLQHLQQASNKLGDKIEQAGTEARQDITNYFAKIRETVSACEQMLLDQVNRAIKTKSFELHDFQQCLSNRLLCSEYSMNSASQLTDTSPLASVVVARDQLTAIVRQFQPASLARNLSKTGVPRVELDHDAVHQIQGILDSLTNVIQIEDDEFDFDWGVDPIPQQIAAENDETPSSGSEGETHNSNDAIKAILHAVDSGKRTTHDAAPEIARIFRHNRVLSTLKLPSSNIQDNAAVALGEALRKNTTIVNAILYSNHIGDSGANELGQALITNKRLEELHLRGKSFKTTSPSLSSHPSPHRYLVRDSRLLFELLGGGGMNFYRLCLPSFGVMVFANGEQAIRLGTKGREVWRKDWRETQR
eukprot:c20275_g1_i6.p1 GENE.c20275_g1_i6~~c20275_g1_i6.p1  ORF type:complete len:567 (+),score=96.76 c20275_g1_i6:44-1744(+)